MTTAAETNACTCALFLTAGWCAAGSEQCETERRLEATAYAINAQHKSAPDNSPAAHTAPAIGIPASAPDDDDWDYALRNAAG